MRMLDLFCGRGGWTNAFLARGWECFGVDLHPQPEYGGQFQQMDILQVTGHALAKFDFICASSPCEEFSVWTMKHFHPNPPHPENGIRLFTHTRKICEASKLPYVMENVKGAQRFIGQAQHRCGSFYLWGSAIPPILPQGIRKGATQMRRDGRYRRHGGVDELMYMEKKLRAKTLSTIPPELANTVADYAERLLAVGESLRPQI